jgi:hypothetical protein
LHIFFPPQQILSYVFILDYFSSLNFNRMLADGNLKKKSPNSSSCLEIDLWD